MENWELVDCTHPIEQGESFPKIIVDSLERLWQEFEWWSQQEPSIIRLDSPDGESLLLGIGGPLAAIRWTKPPSKSNLKMPIANPRFVDRAVEFSFQGQEMGFRAEHIIPMSQAVDIAIYYYAHRQLPDWIQWWEWKEP